MSKAAVAKVFWGSLIGLAAAFVLFLGAGGIALWSDAFIMSGPDVTGIRPDAFSWAMVGLAGVAVMVMAVAAASLFVAWIGAVLNTANLPDKTWFIVLLVGGLLSVGFIVTLIYVLAGPDGQPVPVRAPNQRIPPEDRFRA